MAVLLWLSSRQALQAETHLSTFPSSPYHPTMDGEGLGHLFQQVRRSSCTSHGSLPGTFCSSLDVPLKTHRHQGCNHSRCCLAGHPSAALLRVDTPAPKQFLRTIPPTEHNRVIVTWMPGLSRSSALRNHLEHSRCTDVSPSALPQER